jgi:hypothetical protein
VVILCFMSRGSAVGIVTGYGLVDREVGVRVPVGPRIFTSYIPDRHWIHPTSLRASGALCPVIWRQRCEGHHPPLTSTEVKKTWIYTSTLSTPTPTPQELGQFYLFRAMFLCSHITVFSAVTFISDRLCGLVVRVPTADPDVPSSIPGTTRFSE